MEPNMENNSKMMKTVVETFIIEETKDLIYDNEQLDKWNKHVEELGLKGQTKIVSKEKSPIPFMFIKTGMMNVFKILCPKQVFVEEYDVSPIPVEIMDLIALSKKEKYFNHINIMYDDVTPDPVCVGVNGNFSHPVIPGWFCTKDEFYDAIESKGLDKTEPYFRPEKHYLIGKWADVKHTFPELREMAKQRFIKEKSTKYKKEINENQRKLEEVELNADSLFDGTSNEWEF